MRRYTVFLTPAVDVGGYTVPVPALPGCITEGDTVDEGLANAREAVALHLEALAADREPLPQETAPPELAAVEV